MKTSDILLVIVWALILIEIIVISIYMFKTRQFNHLPTFDYPLTEVYFEVTNIKSIMFNVVEYTITVSFFRKSNCRQFIYDKYKFYDKKDKYSIGDKLYLTKKQ